MATYKLQGNGQYIADGGQPLFNTFKLQGDRSYVDQSGRNLWGGGGTAISPSQSGTQMSSLQRLSQQFQQQMDAANAANQGRYLNGLSLLGLDPNGNLPAADPNKPAPNTLGYIPYAGASGATTGKTAGRLAMETSDADALARGIYNTSTALNTRAVSGGVQARNAANQTADMVYRQRQTDQQNEQAKLGMRLDWLQGKEDVGPNYDQLIQLAQLEGAGNLDGLVDAGGGGGGGGGWLGNDGAAALGYGMGGLGNFLGAGFGGNFAPAPSSRRSSGPTLGQLRNMKKNANKRPTSGVGDFNQNNQWAGGLV